MIKSLSPSIDGASWFLEPGKIQKKIESTKSRCVLPIFKIHRRRIMGPYI